MKFILLKEDGVYMRNLEEDLKICDNASPGPWYWVDVMGAVSEETTWSQADNPPCFLMRELQETTVFTAAELKNMPDEEIDCEIILAGIDDNTAVPDLDAGLFLRKADATFIAQAREGWKEAIRRAMVAEKKLTSLTERTNTK